MFILGWTDRNMDLGPGITFSCRLGGKDLSLWSEKGWVRVDQDRDRVTICLTALKDDFRAELIQLKIVIDQSVGEIEIIKDTTISTFIYRYLKGDELFIFSSVTLLRRIGVPILEDMDNLPEFFLFRYLSPTKTFFKDVEYLDFGSDERFSFKEGKVHISKLSRVRFDRRVRISDGQETASKCKEVIERFFDRKLSHNIKASILFSGGLDSSLLAKLLFDSHGKVRTYSSGYPFEDGRLDVEREYAFTAAKALEADHTHFDLTNDMYLKDTVQAIATYETPLPSYSFPIIHNVINRDLKEHEVILFTGVGADSVFSPAVSCDLYNYGRFTPAFLRRSPFPEIVGTVSKVTGRGRNYYRSLVPMTDPENLIWNQKRYGNIEWVCDHFNVRRNGIIKDSIRIFNMSNGLKLWDRTTDFYYNSAYMDHYLWARSAMGSNKVIISPFLDIELVNLLNTVGSSIRYKSSKNIIKTMAYASGLDKNIIERPKTGLGIKRKDWALKGGPCEPLVRFTEGFFDIEKVRKVQTNVKEDAAIFWNMVNYSIWKRIFILGQDPKEVMEMLDLDGRP
jgi:hypothetical protein